MLWRKCGSRQSCATIFTGAEAEPEGPLHVHCGRDCTRLVSNILTTLTPNKHTTFVSRMFAPLNRITEDQVTGSAHSMLVRYWTARLGSQKGDGDVMYA
ncbi:hypothetical protein BDN67DRAFT_961829 [Paxillus ammoniavirescens]|nr:hypothetical protein BDN67DRAFT_961829 [Paxillus ammoniavirescens]